MSAKRPSGAARANVRQRRSDHVEFLERRLLLSESATAQLSLISTTITSTGTVYTYQMTVTDTGTTNIGTFWFGWVPGQDFLASQPGTVASPSGWTEKLTGSNNSSDGTAIQWVASSQLITPGSSLAGFGFTTTDSPAALAGNSVTHPQTPVLTSFVYSGAPFSDSGFEFVATSDTSSGSVLTVDGTSGDDAISLTSDGTNLTVTLNGTVAAPLPQSQITSIDIEAGAGNDTVTLGANVPGASLQGGPGDDTLVGGSGNDTLGGGQGADVISGGPGDDSIKGGAADDSLAGGQGNDTILGGLGNDTIRGALGDDSLNGGAGTNQLTGGQGNNTFYAVNGTSDRIFAGTATDDSLFYSTADSPIIESGTLPPGNQILVM
jgi:Ca2+-binding RTX toxin-like protein